MEAPSNKPESDSEPTFARICKNCVYCSRKSGNQCVRFPEWIVVQADHFCGEFKLKYALQHKIDKWILRQ